MTKIPSKSDTSLLTITRWNTGGFRTVLWDAPKDPRTAVEDVVVLLTYLQKRYQDLSQGATAQLLVLCNRTAVHNQLLQHGFQTAWLDG